MRLSKVLAVSAAVTVLAAVSAQAHTMGGQLGSERTFAAVLLPVAGGPPDGLGWVMFSQPRDAQKVVFLDVWVLNLAPTHSYLLQRATDPTVDDQCTGTNWLTLGHGLAPAAITTNSFGLGAAHLFRDLSTVPTGTRLDIHFRVIDATTSAVVLLSPCHQFIVSE